MDNIYFKVEDYDILKERFYKYKRFVNFDDILSEMEDMQGEIDELNNEIWRLTHREEIAYDEMINQRIDEMLLERNSDE